MRLVPAFSLTFVGFLLGAVFFVAASVVIAWTGPLNTAPTCPSGQAGCDAPINVGASDQIKNAILSLNGLAVFGNAILNGASRYLNFGSSAGSSGYGIRDNSGVMEFKNLGGAWATSASLAANGGLSVPTSASVTACNAAAEGTTRYNPSSKQMEFCNGTAWSSFGSAGITSCRVCTRFRYEWYGYKWSAQGCSAYSSGNNFQTADSGGGYGYIVQVETSIQCQ